MGFNYKLYAVAMILVLSWAGITYCNYRIKLIENQVVEVRKTRRLRFDAPHGRAGSRRP